jgi:16S rRNA (guanine966-N2)-methyltransferase
MRIIAGKHRGRRIEAPETRNIRPTTSRTREAVFNILVHSRFGLEESPLYGRVADIFCGSGAMGLEALSRGAGHVTFVDKSRESIEVLEYNIENFGEEENSRILRSDSSHLPPVSEPFDLLIMDPPYHTGLAFHSLKTASKGGWLHENTITVLELAWKEDVKIPKNFEILEERRYGNTRIVILRLAAA